MSEHKIDASAGLPENAYRELKEGEKYEPILSPHKTYPEVTPYSVASNLHFDSGTCSVP